MENGCLAYCAACRCDRAARSLIVVLLRRSLSHGTVLIDFVESRSLNRMHSSSPIVMFEVVETVLLLRRYNGYFGNIYCQIPITENFSC